MDPSTRSQPPPGRDGGGGFNQKMMGLPVWAWVALAAAGGIAFVVWRQSRNKATADDTTAPTTTDAQGLDVEQYESLLALLRDLQGQNSVPAEGGDTPNSDDPTTQLPGSGTPGAPHPTGPTPAPGSARGYGWHKVVAKESPASISKGAGISTATFYAYNGPGALKAGEYVKTRWASNPAVGPYNGK